MEQKNNISTEIRNIIPFAKFMEDHPVITNIILALEVALIFWAVLTYNFTTTV